MKVAFAWDFPGGPVVKNPPCNLEFGISGYKLPCIKQINNKVPLYSIGNYIQYLIINYNGKESEKEYICITESLCYTPETNTTL